MPTIDKMTCEREMIWMVISKDITTALPPLLSIIVVTVVCRRVNRVGRLQRRGRGSASGKDGYLHLLQLPVYSGTSASPSFIRIHGLNTGAHFMATHRSMVRNLLELLDKHFAKYTPACCIYTDTSYLSIGSASMVIGLLSRSEPALQVNSPTSFRHRLFTQHGSSRPLAAKPVHIQQQTVR